MSAVPLRVLRVRDADRNAGFGETVDAHDLSAALDLARLDLEGHRQGQPVWQLLGAGGAPDVEVNATIATTDPASAAREALAALEAGFRCVKVKVGGGGEMALLEAVRAAIGDRVAIRIDANGAWSPTQAVSALATLEPIGIECCEEPCSGTEAIARVAAQTPIPISIDETSAQPGALEQRVCCAVCLKVARWGGIRGLLRAARRARAAGYEIYLASMLDGPLGIAAALHAAAVLRPDRPCGLATLPRFEGRADPLPARAGRIPVPAGPGLGDGLLDWYGELLR